MVYMMSKSAYLTDEDDHNVPHLMFFTAVMDAKDWGSGAAGRPLPPRKFIKCMRNNEIRCLGRGVETHGLHFSRNDAACKERVPASQLVNTRTTLAVQDPIRGFILTQSSSRKGSHGFPVIECVTWVERLKKQNYSCIVLFGQRKYNISIL